MLPTRGFLKNILSHNMGSKYYISIVFKNIFKVASDESFKEFEKTSKTWLFIFLKDIFWVLKCEYFRKFSMTFLGPLNMDF